MPRRVAVIAVCLIPLLGACSDSAKAEDPAKALAAAKTTLDGAKAVTLDLKSSAPIPQGHNGVSAAQGDGIIDATTPKFKGKVSAVVNGTPATVDMVAIGDKTWMSLFTPKLIPVDVTQFGAPNPGTFFKPDVGLSSLLAKATGPAADKQERYGGEVLQYYTAKVPGQVIVDLLHIGSAGASFDGRFGIEPKTGQLRVAKLTGPYYEGSTGTYTVVLTNYGKTVDIQQPS